ncbi:MAG: hypothetical protein ACRD0Q_08155 [Acidimicrobiales bacterium]
MTSLSLESWRQTPLATRLHWALRIGVVMEFVGHGLAGLYQSKAWIPYFGLFGISERFAVDHMMYVTGVVDIILGALVLYRPMRAVLLYMTFWGFMTAWLRPLAGESWFELVERGANYGMPLAFLMLAGWGGRSLRRWFEHVRPDTSPVLDENLRRQLSWVLRISVALLLVGHGGLGVWADKKEWFDFFGWFGVGQATVASVHLMQWVGVFEIVLGVAVLVKPLRGLLVFVLVWKVGTELLRPLVGQPNFQFIERGGNYILPIALVWLVGQKLRRVDGPATSAAKSPASQVGVA